MLITHIQQVLACSVMVLTVTDANNCAANSNTISIAVNPSSNLSGTVTVFPTHQHWYLVMLR